jgi:hypothetical protein
MATISTVAFLVLIALLPAVMVGIALSVPSKRQRLHHHHHTVDARRAYEDPNASKRQRLHHHHHTVG